MTIGPRRLVTVLGLTVSIAAFLLTRDSVCRPEWSRLWPSSPSGILSSSNGLSLTELSRLAWPNRALSSGKASRPGHESPPALGPERGSFYHLYEAVKAGEYLGYQQALQLYAAYLDQVAARRLNAERLAWEERLRDRALQLAEEGECRLEVYIDSLRQEYYGAISSLEMQIALAESRADKEDIERKLAATKAEIEKKIAQYRDDLARECALQLGVLQAQARDAIARLEARLKEETGRSMADFARAERERYDLWSARIRQAEAGLKLD